MTSLEAIAVTLLVTEALEELGVAYFIGGSLATALHGIARTTMDVDIVADLHPQHVEPFTGALADAFYVDAGMIYDAIQYRSSFNLIHLETLFKVDIFINKERPFDRLQFERCSPQALTDDPERVAYVSSPEDNILAKLEWYRIGGEVSERQWSDVVNVFKVQAGRLDEDYLRHWAGQLGVLDLLEQANEAAS